MTKEQKFLIELIIDDVARYLIEDTGASVIEALDTVYHSQFYDKLMDTEYLKHELKYGKAV